MSLIKNKYIIALSSFPKFGPVRLKKLRHYFSDYKKAFQGNLFELKKAGIEEPIASEFISWRNESDPNKLISDLIKEKINIITLDDPLYPRLLKEIYNPPALLDYRGQFTKDLDFSFAVVGTRKYSPYGQQVTSNIVEDLVRNNFIIVSGLALGIDTIAHNTTLKTGGRTIAVLGCGLDKQSIYPSSNRYLAEKIISQNGLVISEFPLLTPPLRHHFPQRNRIISGLSLGTLVIEAAKKSGALITASTALEQNREVFAVPGSIYSLVSEGPNNLIKQGATAISGVEDILTSLDLKEISTYINNKKILPESREEEALLKNLSRTPLHINDIIIKAKLPAATVSATLTMMEMKGLVRNLGSMQYVLAH